MTLECTYLDYNATAPMPDEVHRAVVEALALPGNPSSVHGEGRKAKAAVERARSQVAALAGCAPGEVVFTSGGTEANAMVIGQPQWDALLVSAIEHDCVLASAKSATGALELIPAHSDGSIDTDWLDARCAQLQSDGRRVLVSVQAANNETGAIQPLARVAEICSTYECLMHSDAVQAAGRLPLDFAGSGAAFMALSAHKIGGPKGVGALIVKADQKLVSLIRGGGQESGRRAGTENVAGIVGFGAAAEFAQRQLTDMDRLRGLRDLLEQGLHDQTPEDLVVAGTSERLANTSCIALPGARAETLVIALDLAGIAVSAGSACSSGKVARSHVLQAMGLAGDVIEGAIRVSLGWGSTENDVHAFLKAWCTATEGRRTAASVA